MVAARPRLRAVLGEGVEQLVVGLGLGLGLGLRLRLGLGLGLG